MYIPKRPLWLRKWLLTRLRNHLTIIASHAERSLNAALQTFPEERNAALNRMARVDAELRKIEDLRYAIDNPRTTS